MVGRRLTAKSRLRSRYPSPYRTFWQAGYEGADHVNLHGQPLSMNAATGHHERISEDYTRLAEFGIRSRTGEAGVGDAAKRVFVRATIAACDAIREVDPRARFLICDPLINVVPADSSAEQYLDLIGANYYHDNQWEAGTAQRLWWHLADRRRASLSSMLEALHTRYLRPILLAETSHFGSGRGAWIREVAQQAALALQNGVDLQGLCIYPVIDRPDWNDPGHWHRSGLWEVAPQAADPPAACALPALCPGSAASPAPDRKYFVN